jgi:hypothetical protein
MGSIQTFQEVFFLVVVGVGGCGGVGVGVGVMEVDLFLGGRDISMKGVPDFQALFKKRSEIK